MAVGLNTLRIAALGALVGALLAVPLVSALLPTLDGPEIRAWWLVSRSAGLVAFALLTASMASGMLITTRMSRAWPGGPLAFELHRQTTVAGLALAVVHALVLLGDPWLQPSVAGLLLPFAAPVKAMAVAAGQVALWIGLAVGLSFRFKAKLGRKAWRSLHFASFAVWALALAHGLAAGTDTARPAVAAIYWAAGALVLFLALVRVVQKVEA